MSSLSLKHIYKVYPNGAKAVNDFSLEINDKEFVVFVGPSGCGKSTTLRMIAGLEDISAGELYIDNKFVNVTEPKNRDIAMVFQNYALYPHMTVFDNIAFGLKLRHVDKKEIKAKVAKAAEMLGLTDYLDRKPGAMSGGQRQRVALGRALVREPKVFLLDEPLSNLDAKLRASMRSEISKLHSKLQTTFIYVTHDQIEAMTMGDRIVVMKDGFIQQVASPKDLYRYPNNKFVAGFIGTPQMNFFNVTFLAKQKNVDLKFTDVDFTIPMPRALLNKVDRVYFDGQHKAILGIRCENISLNEKAYPFKCQCRISQLEELGTETLVHADLNIDADVFALGEENATSSTAITVKASATYAGKVGDIITISLDLAEAHFFDGETERVINPYQPVVARMHATIKNKELFFGKNKFQLPPALQIENGEYDVVVPTSSIKVGNVLPVEVISREELGDKYLYLAALNDDIVSFVDEKKHNVGDTVKLEIDLKYLTFVQDGKTVLEALNLTNVLSGEIYHHNEKVADENNKAKKHICLDYIIANQKFACSKPTAYRSFIEIKNKEVFDLDIDFKFSPYAISLKEDGLLQGEVVEILDYRQELFAKVNVNNQTIIVSIPEPISLGIHHFDINTDEVDVFDSKKAIKLA